MERRMVLELVTKVVPFLVLVFCDVGSALPLRNICPLFKPYCKFPSRALFCSPYDINCNDVPPQTKCKPANGLPCEEVDALTAVMEGLDLPSTTIEITQDVCSSDIYANYIGCICTSDQSKTTVCHIIRISIQNFDLGNGYIDGNVSMLSSLVTLDLSSNRLRCKIPNFLGSLKALKYLLLNNNFLHGSIPPSLGDTSLVKLDLSDNMLYGEIPRELGRLSDLTLMDLHENQLHGNIPAELGNLTNLRALDLRSNSLTGILPENLSDLSSLRYFGVGGNSLNGLIPKFISTWKNLTRLVLEGNDFEDMPLEIFNMPSLERLWVSDLKNTKGFQFPNKVNLPIIQTLVLRNCSISGQIPSYIGNLSHLKYLDLSFNNLTGGIPDSLQQNMPTLILTRNMLDGQIPSWIISSRKNSTDLSYNNFSNSSVTERSNTTIMPNMLPNSGYETQKRKCPSTYHNLFINCGGKTKTHEGNQYDEDTSQDKFFESSDKRWAYTCNGHFLTNNANSSDYIKNKTCGVSDVSLQETCRLCPVSLTYYGFCLRNGEYRVKLKFAEIVFANDGDYTSRLKRVFDVYIQGERKLRNFNIVKDVGEPNTARTKKFTVRIRDNPLVIHFFWASKGSLEFPSLNGPLVSAISVTPKFRVSGGLSAAQIAGIIVGCAFALTLLVAFLWKMGWLRNRELQKVYVVVKGRRFTLQQIINATRNFSPKMEIGIGRFGIVYRADLPDQIKVAVKKISPDLMQDKLKTELQGEIFNLKALKHENLIQLFDGYSRKHMHLLIYEYMEKGSIRQALLDPEPTTVLDWKVRYDICLGIAEGLKHLHEGTGVKILHRNIKASNILLDKTYTAKLTDFGLARLYNEEDPFMTIKAGAARVYIAPEYALGKPITDKADVYSYGVIALEVFSGRPSVENKPNQEGAYLIDDARIAHAQGRIDKLVDRKMENYDRKAAFMVLNLAITCIHPTADLRPTMSEVVTVLSGERTLDQISKVHVS